MTKSEAPVSCARLFPSHNDNVAYGCHGNVDHSRWSRLSACPLRDQTVNDRESHGATETHRPERGLVWGCFHLLRHQTGEVCSTGQTALLMFLLYSYESFIVYANFK